MPYVKIKQQGNKRIIADEFADSKSARKSVLKTGEVMLHVRSIEVYKQQTNDWNLSQDIIAKGEPFPEPKPKLTANINPDFISEKGKKVINKARKSNEDTDWFKVMNIHNEEKWSAKEYCCKGHLDFIKWQIQKLVNNGWS